MSVVTAMLRAVLLTERNQVDKVIEALPADHDPEGPKRLDLNFRRSGFDVAIQSLDQLDEIDRLKAEIEQLKAELAEAKSLDYYIVVGDKNLPSTVGRIERDLGEMQKQRRELRREVEDAAYRRAGGKKTQESTRLREILVEWAEDEMARMAAGIDTAQWKYRLNDSAVQDEIRVIRGRLAARIGEREIAEEIAYALDRPWPEVDGDYDTAIETLVELETLSIRGTAGAEPPQAEGDES